MQSNSANQTRIDSATSGSSRQQADIVGRRASGPNDERPGNILSRIVGRFRIHRQQRHRLRELRQPSAIDPTVTFGFHERIEIGRYTRLGAQCHLDGEGEITIGDGTTLAARVVILSSTHRYQQTDYLPYDESDEHRPVHIGRGVWIGWGAMIVPGVEIGDGAVVGMGAVVSRSVPPGAIVVGNPARIVSSRDREIVQDLTERERYFLKANWEEGLKRNR